LQTGFGLQFCYFKAMLRTLYAHRSAVLGCTILLTAAAQAPRHSMRKLPRTPAKADRQAALLCTCQAVERYLDLHLCTTCFAGVLVAIDLKLPCASRPQPSAAVHRQLPTPRYAPLAADGIRGERHVLWRGTRCKGAQPPTSIFGDFLPIIVIAWNSCCLDS
jgi:hypothetical protein